MMYLDWFSWVLLVNSKGQALRIWSYISMTENIYINAYGILHKPLISMEGQIFGSLDDKSFIIITNSIGTNAVHNLIKTGLIAKDDILCVDDLNEEDIFEDIKLGTIIKNVEYLDYSSFIQEFD